ncbi:MAG: hypothetical protein R3B67_11490 [Phycisphaerales bacterium]
MTSIAMRIDKADLRACVQVLSCWEFQRSGVGADAELPHLDAQATNIAGLSTAVVHLGCTLLSGDRWGLRWL